MAIVREDLMLTKAQIGNTIIASVAITVLVRLMIGPLCDKFGSRLTYTWLLILGSLPVMGIGLAQSYESFLLFRLAIGAIGASFVITQYHTSMMFAPNCVGTANATTAGWGNLGGGVTQMVMPLIFSAFLMLGVGKFVGWRLAMIIPGAVLFVTGIAYYFFTQDAPDGNYRDLRAQGRMAPRSDKSYGSFAAATRDYRVWALFVIYAACFGIEVGERGGVAVNDLLQTSDPSIYAIGEVALHGGMIYGLVAPGYEMAETVATNLTGGDARFTGADLSTRLKLMGVDVASFGDYEVGAETARPLTWEDPFDGVYKKLLFSPDGIRLLGGVLVGDAGDYGTLSMLAKSGEPLPCRPNALILGASGGAGALAGVDAMADAAQICSCNNVTKGAICDAMRDQDITSLGELKTATRAGSGCGGCMPLVTDLFNGALAAAGVAVSHHLCEHFRHSRTELFAIIKAKQLKTFDEIIRQYGSGNGCEVCKPAVTSILAALWNETISDPAHHTLQDTNDRFLANMQRGGLYSVIPRVPGGEITPDKLIALGQTARDYGLYTKITGGQRIDLFGAQLQNLPDIWEKLVDAGFESGHAYGKALRTVKSCVGTTWCRYGVQDSVGFAVRVENRYKSIRAPHKIKSAVSGCVRECAEAQGKDFGLVATERGYNLYVGGNGGAKPRHADLLAADLDEETAIRYIDRFLMYYIMTADKLTRTAVWLDKMAGGVEHLREVIVDDKLGICGELDSMMQFLVDSYRCEWADVVNDPEKRRLFRQFVNTDATEPTIEIVAERGQRRPADWPTEPVSLQQIEVLDRLASDRGGTERAWVKVGSADDFPPDGGATVKYGGVQIAVFNFSSRGEWYASQQMCPHKKAFVLSRGILGDAGGVPKIACPLHKKTFSLESGDSLGGEDYGVQVFPVKVEDGEVYLHLPPTEVLERSLATEIGCEMATACSADDGMLLPVLASSVFDSE